MVIIELWQLAINCAIDVINYMINHFLKILMIKKFNHQIFY